MAGDVLPVAMFTCVYALNLINRRFGSLFWLIGVPIGSLFQSLGVPISLGDSVNVLHIPIPTSRQMHASGNVSPMKYL